MQYLIMALNGIHLPPFEKIFTSPTDTITVGSAENDGHSESIKVEDLGLRSDEILCEIWTGMKDLFTREEQKIEIAAGEPRVLCRGSRKTTEGRTISIDWLVAMKGGDSLEISFADGYVRRVTAAGTGPLQSALKIDIVRWPTHSL